MDTIAQLHRAWIGQLRREWRQINDEHLDGQLRPPIFAIDRSERRLGRWEQGGRILGIAEQHIWDHPWDEVLETLKHEMAHQVVFEIHRVRHEAPHGPTFARACRKLGIEPEASGRPGTTATSRADRILAKVRKLLALAASDNPHEARAAMAAANTLLLRYNLELPSADSAPGYGFRRIGRTAAALQLPWKVIARVLEEFFFVECIWVSVYNARKDRMERQLEICGNADNLEFAAYVHDFLHDELARSWRLEQRKLGRTRLAGGARSRKREFSVGLLSGLRDKLREERSHNEERGLIWVGDPGLDGYFHKRYPRIRKLSGGGVHRSDAYEAGQLAGRSLTIHRPVRGGGKGGARKLLK